MTKDLKALGRRRRRAASPLPHMFPDCRRDGAATGHPPDSPPRKRSRLDLRDNVASINNVSQSVYVPRILKAVVINNMQLSDVHHFNNMWVNGTLTTPPPDSGCVANNENQTGVSKTITPRRDAFLAFHNSLALHLDNWRYCGAGPWVLNTIARGYKLQFAKKPPAFQSIISSNAVGQAAQILQAEIISLLDKKAIREVPRHQRMTGFYSRYFLVKKKGGGMRPILDLRALNQYLKVFNFKMLTSATLLRMIRQGDWFTSIDLKDAYFHVPIYPSHRKYLRFAFQGKVYEYLVLPFGLRLSPRTFVKCTQAAIAPLRQRGIRLCCYLDDWLICSETEQSAKTDLTVVMDHLDSLGFKLNLEKSVMKPSQKIDFIGITLDASSLTARLSQERLESFMMCMALFRLGHKVRFASCLRLVGLMASAIALVRLGRLYMRPFQRWVQSLGVPIVHKFRRVVVTDCCVSALQQWRNERFLTEGVSIGMITSRKVITTDASLTGWGATHEGRCASGVWDEELATAHINYLELKAVFLALQHFASFIQGCHVLIRTDNTTTMCYINKQGGLRSPVLHKLAQELILWCDAHLTSIRACHVPGLLNRGADLLSRGHCRYDDWSLHPLVMQEIRMRFGSPIVDLFASEENTKCPLFFAFSGVNTLGLDAMAYDWPEGLLYAFPPLSLIPPTLERVRCRGLTLILIAPGWGSWRSEISHLLYDNPWKLPLRRDLLTQAGAEIFHPRPADLDLWAWPLKG